MRYNIDNINWLKNLKLNLNKNDHRITFNAIHNASEIIENALILKY